MFGWGIASDSREVQPGALLQLAEDTYPSLNWSIEESGDVGHLKLVAGTRGLVLAALVKVKVGKDEIADYMHQVVDDLAQQTGKRWK